MKIGIVTARVGHNDGQGRVNWEIAAEALRQGHDVRLFSEHVDDGLGERGLDRHVMVPPSWLPSRLLRDQVFALRSRSQIARAANACDAVLSNGFATWMRSDVNAVHFVHGSWRQSPHHPWRLHKDARTFYAAAYSRLNATLERVAFRRSTTMVAVSAKVAGELARIGVPPARIVTITNGVDTAEFHPGAAERARFGLPVDVPLALFAGDLKSPRKNLETVLRALVDVPELHLAVAGRIEGSASPAQAESLGVASRVHFIGFQRDMPALMRSVDLFAFPSRYEACSLVLLEALASGLPVVTASSAGGAELITPDVGVVLEDSDDHRRLADTLRALVTDPAERSAMGARARAVAEHHSWSGMAQRYIGLLEAAAAARNASAAR